MYQCIYLRIYLSIFFIGYALAFEGTKKNSKIDYDQQCKTNIQILRRVLNHKTFYGRNLPVTVVSQRVGHCSCLFSWHSLTRSSRDVHSRLLIIRYYNQLACIYVHCFSHNQVYQTRLETYQLTNARHKLLQYFAIIVEI